MGATIIIIIGLFSKFSASEYITSYSALNFMQEHYMVICAITSAKSSLKNYMYAIKLFAHLHK